MDLLHTLACVCACTHACVQVLGDNSHGSPTILQIFETDALPALFWTLSKAISKVNSLRRPIVSPVAELPLIQTRVP